MSVRIIGHCPVSADLKSFSPDSDREKAVLKIFETIGTYCELSRINVFENAQDGLSFSKIYEWCAPGVASNKSEMRNVPLAPLGGYYGHFDENNVFCAESSSFLDGAVRDLMEVQGVKATVQVAVKDSERNIGFVGFDDCSGPRKWRRDEIYFLIMLAQFMAIFILNRRSERQSDLNKNLALNFINAIDSGVYVVDAKTYELLFANPAMREMVPEAEPGKACYSFFSPDKETPCEHCPLHGCREASGQARSFEYFNKARQKWMHVSSFLSEWFDGRTVCYICVTDVSEKHRHESMIERLAYYDDLTDLPNIHKYAQLARKALAEAELSGRFAAVMALKVESLFQVNIAKGHAGGDEILKAFVGAMRRVLPEGSLLARVRGNDFGVLCLVDKELGEAGVRELVGKMRESAAEIKLPTYAGEDLTFSMGVSLFPKDGQDFEELNHKAGLALSSAGSGKRSVFYDAELADAEEERGRLVHDLAVAITDMRQFELWHQPKYDMRTGRLNGSEALIRWNHPERGRLAGGLFIPLAEEHNFIARIDDWVIEEVCRQLREAVDLGLRPVTTAINISPDAFYSDTVVEKLTAALRRYSLDPSLLEVEITERMTLANMGKAAEIMRELRALGIKIAIDDFGTGYSALSYLCSLPFDVLKIDRSFLHVAADAAKVQGIIRFMVDLAAGLNVSVVIEGVETGEQFKLALNAGCDTMQGFYSGRPVRFEDFLNLLRAPCLIFSGVSPQGSEPASVP